MIYGNGNPSLANRIQSAFKSEMSMDTYKAVSSHRMLTETHTTNNKSKISDGCIVCGKTVCGSEDKVKKRGI